MATTLLQQVHRDMFKDAVPLIQELRKKQGDNISENDIREQFHAAFDKHTHRNLEYAQECFNRSDMVIVSSNFASADFRKIKTYNFRKSESY